MKTPHSFAPHAASNRNGFPFDLHWTSHDLADAVPLRLSEMPIFQMDDHGVASANATSLQRARRSTSFLPSSSTASSSLPVFRTR